MADKFIIDGATYCGDGTTSSEAASAGAAGAWNDISIFAGETTPAYGTLAAGDRVYVRSLDSSGSAITVTASAGSVYIGSAAATSADPIVWVIDAGVIWSGVEGTIELEITGDNVGFRVRSYNHILGKDLNWEVIYKWVTNSSTATLLGLDHGTRIVGLYLDNTLDGSGVSGGGYKLIAATSNTGSGSLFSIENCYIKYRYIYAQPFEGAQYGTMNFINCTIEKTDLNEDDDYFVQPGSYGGCVRFVGGALIGDGIPEGFLLVGGSGTGGDVHFLGFQYPRYCQVRHTGSPRWVYSQGGDGLGGIYVSSPYGDLDSRDDGYYPYLNAARPDSSSTPVSCRLYAHSASANKVFPLPPFSKIYTQSAAAKTITLYMLVNTTYGVPNKEEACIHVCYTDSGGTVRNETTYVIDGGSLDSGSSGWSATTYGAASFTSVKLALTTQYSIKQDTAVLVTLMWAKTANTTEDVVFICPDIEFS